MLIMKREKRQITEGKERPSQERIVRRKGNLQAFGKFGNDTIKRVEMKEKIIKGEHRNFSKPSSAIEIPSKR